MDSVKKAKFEQRMIFVLLVIFAACFVQMLKRLGFVGSKARPPAVATTPVAAPAPAAVQAVERYRQRLDEVQTLGLGTVIRPAEAPAPSAAGEPEAGSPRDPLMSLLPSELPSSPTTAAKGKAAGTPTAIGGTSSSGGTGGAVGGTGQTEVKPPPLTVHGVIVGGQRPQALIDEGVYGVGDLVKGVRIIAIEREGVLVIAPGGIYRLSPDARAALVKQEGSP